MDEKKDRLEDKEDRISELPDFLIHHILCFLPSAREAIQTGVLSKRWRNQWAIVPVVVLDDSVIRNNENFFKFMDCALRSYDHFSFKINKFCLLYDPEIRRIDPWFDTRISFAIRKNVEELVLKCSLLSSKPTLPEHLFNYANLVKLHALYCIVRPVGGVNWKHLKELRLCSCKLPNQATESLLSGSWQLELLVLHYCSGFDRLVIASKSLERLFLIDSGGYDVEFSCPKLKALTFMSWTSYCTLSNQAIDNALSGCPLLGSLVLHRCNGFDKLVIATKHLQRLVLRELKVPVIKISGPNLEEMELEKLKNVETFKLMDVTSSLVAATDWRKAFVYSNKFVGSI